MKNTNFRFLFCFFLGLILLGLASCAPAATSAPESKPDIETRIVKETQIVEKEVTEEPAMAEKTRAPEPEEPAEATRIPPTPTVQSELMPTEAEEKRTAELEWPSRLRYGESDTVRLTLIPGKDEYIVKSEFPEHQVEGQELRIPRPGGYELWAIAELEGVGFETAPKGRQSQWLPVDQAVTWRWTVTPRRPGQQRMAVNLWLRWIPEEGKSGVEREFIAFSKTLDVDVSSILGMGQPQAVTLGISGLFFGSLLCLAAIVVRPNRIKRSLQPQAPNPGLMIETPQDFVLSQAEHRLLSALFNRYSRLILEKEFLSGYSGARTFLALPIRPDGRIDAYTIAKFGDAETIGREFTNYEAFVKDTLPPVTARIQHTPIVVDTGKRTNGDPKTGNLAALQYTFIGEQGSLPTSLRQVLISDPRVELLDKLFQTFGPNWWMQRKPYTFRMALEYDRLLPTHLVLEPAAGTGQTIDTATPPDHLQVSVGEIIHLHGFKIVERKPNRGTISLEGQPAPGQVPLRVRWQSLETPRQFIGRVTATRQTLLQNLTYGMDRAGLPDPIDRLPEWLNETVTSTQSTIHGDLNLENILLGPGDLVWLIDFAQTRDGPPLFDFAHLEAELVAHILAPQIEAIEDFRLLIAGNPPSEHIEYYELDQKLQRIALRCLANPTRRREWDLARSMAFLGALKHTNLDTHQRHCLYSAAILVASSL